MKANELRIGILVEYMGIIQPTTLTIIRECQLNNATTQPIPITEEWHNKFGVERNGFNSFEYNLTHRKKVVFTGDYIYLLDIDSMDGKKSIEDDICTLWNNDIKRRSIYVHEWQNLYFALNGEELEIRKGKS